MHIQNLKIIDPLPVPTACDNCGSKAVEYTSNAAIYGKEYGDWPYCYMCRECSAMVSCHPNTEIPMGLMADTETRQLRKKAHFYFDQLWRSKLLTRSMAYKWLAYELEIEPDRSHISMLTKYELKRVVRKAAKFFNERRNIVATRKLKREEGKERKKARVKRHIERRKDR